MTTRFDTVAVVRSCRSRAIDATRRLPAQAPGDRIFAAKAPAKTPKCDHDETIWRSFDRLQRRHRPAGAGLASPNSPAHAQSADLVLCDRLAADPGDPDKPEDVKGTPEIAQSDIATAIKFCRVASAASRRALYQLGRAYAANQQMPEAMSAYRKAADKGSTSAMVELGVMLATGSGVAKDEAQARKLFERAAAAAIRAAPPISRRSRAGRRTVGCGRRHTVGSRQGQSLACESGGDEFGGSAVSARIDDRGRRRRAEGRCCRARVV